MTPHLPPDHDRRAALRRALGLALGAAPLAAGLAGCTSPPRTDYHVLHDTGPPSAAAAPRIDKVLLVAAASAATLYDSDRMVFSADGRSRSYFQFGFWTERPARRLLSLAQDRLAAARVFRDVALGTAGVRGDLLLTLRLESLYLDDAVDPAQARLAFTGELVDWRARRLLGRRDFARSAAASSRDAAAFAVAASAAMGTLLAELVDWAAAIAATAPAG